MNVFTTIFVWIEPRAYVVAATVLTWQVVKWSQRYSELALTAHADLTGTAAVIGAVSAVAGAVQAFAFKHYLDSRGPQ